MSPLTGLTTKDCAFLGGSPLRLECFGVVACRSLRSSTMVSWIWRSLCKGACSAFPDISRGPSCLQRKACVCRSWGHFNQSRAVWKLCAVDAHFLHAQFIRMLLQRFFIKVFLRTDLSFPVRVILKGYLSLCVCLCGCVHARPRAYACDILVHAPMFFSRFFLNST